MEECLRPLAAPSTAIPLIVGRVHDRVRDLLPVGVTGICYDVESLHREPLSGASLHSISCIYVQITHMYAGGFMPNTQTLIAQAYSAFNHRDIDSALELMSENVSWPKASEGGRAVGKEEIRAYWTRQWKQFDPHVEPIEVIDREGGITDVKVHQLVKSLAGEVLSDSEVWHVYTIANGLIERMDIKQSEASSNPAPSAAFSRH